MNKKGIFGEIVGSLMVCAMGYILFILATSISGDYQKYKAYNTFCEERPDFCYCKGVLSCEFRTSSTCINNECNYSQDTIDLCKLAESMADKEVIFRVGC